jgi:hypothetical protein
LTQETIVEKSATDIFVESLTSVSASAIIFLVLAAMITYLFAISKIGFFEYFILIIMDALISLIFRKRKSDKR